MESHLKWPDYLILVGFLIISLAIGFYHSVTGGRQKTTAEFILADRRLSVIPTAISLLVSFLSAIMILGMTAEMYCYGVQYFIFSTIAIALAVLLAERLVVPWLYPLQLVSVYDYLERRYFSKSIRIFGASLGIAVAVLFMGVAMYAPSAALESATGFPLTVSIPLMTVVSVTYTALGGMRAVIWTDVFQFLTMIGGIATILVKGLIVVGGITNVFRLAEEEGRLVLANVSFDPRERHTAWSLMIAGVIGWFNGYGFQQASVQRYSAVDRLSKARLTVLLNCLPNITVNAMNCIIGLVVVAYYASIKCDPLANKDIANPNQLLPYFVVTLFSDSPGFAGLFLSTLYGGALSSVSSMLSGTAANCWEDILKWKLKHLTETRKALINRLLVVLFGALATGVAFLPTFVPGPISQLVSTMCNSANGPLLAIFILGGISKHANWKGTLLGGIVGLVFTLWLCIGSVTLRNKHPPLPPLSVEQCSIENRSFTFYSSSPNYTNYTSFELLDGINWNQTTGALSGSRSQVTQLRGLENFYAVSYLWISPFGVIVTGVIGIIASLIMRDRELEKKVDERLLLRFHRCRWSGDNENTEHLDDNDSSSQHGNNNLKGAGDVLLQDVKMTAPRKSGNRFHKPSKPI